MLPTRVLVLTVAVLSGSLQATAQTPPKPAEAPPASKAPAAPSKPAETAPATPAPASKPAEPEPDESGVDEDKPAEKDSKASAPGKREACRNEAKAKKLKGLERVDSLQLCVAEARVSCVKEAIAKKMPPKDRRAFFKSCMN